MGEKIGRLGPGPRVNLLSHGRENLQESNVLHDNFFSLPKKGHGVISHVIKAFWMF